MSTTFYDDEQMVGLLTCVVRELKVPEDEARRVLTRAAIANRRAYCNRYEDEDPSQYLRPVEWSAKPRRAWMDNAGAYPHTVREMNGNFEYLVWTLRAWLKNLRYNCDDELPKDVEFTLKTWENQSEAQADWSAEVPDSPMWVIPSAKKHFGGREWITSAEYRAWVEANLKVPKGAVKVSA